MHNSASFKPISVRLNVEHPLANGLAGAWFFNEGYGSTIKNWGMGNYGNFTGSATMQTTPVWSGSPWGLGLKFDATASDYATFGAFNNWRPATNTLFSIAARAFVPSTDTGAVIWTNDDTQDKYSGITLLCSGGGSWSLRLGNNGTIGTSNRKDFLTTTAVGGGVWSSVLFNVFSMTTHRAFVNGFANTGSTSGSATSIGYTAASSGSMGREDISSGSGPYYSSHTIDYIYFWYGRIVPDAMAQSLAEDPYEMFETTSRAKFFTTVPVGWGHNINGVANASISKINGVSKASISKVCGV